MDFARYLEEMAHATEAEDNKCNRDKLFALATNSQMCEFINSNCGDLADNVNLLKMQYCTFNGNWIVPFLLLVILIRFLVKFLDHISDTYMSSAIAKISQRMRLNEALAGVTLLAFANGATDIITVFVASGDEGKDGDDLAIGSLFGAGLFGMTVVQAYIILKAKNNIIDRVKPVLPDSD